MTSINVEGVILPNVPLSNFQILDAAKKLKIKTSEEYLFVMSFQKDQKWLNVVY